MIRKFALSDCTPVVAKSDGSAQMIRTAGNVGRVIVEAGSDKARILEAEIKKHPTALFFRAKAIKADEPNSNGDYFSEDELMKSYKSFEGVPFFTNHENQDIEKAKGKIIFAEWIPEEKAVYTISFVDREAYPHICRSIEEGYASGVSMGCSVEYSVCNICGNRAEKTEDYCFVPETPILMSDLSVKNIEDIKIGDEVIDAFGNVTKVTNTFVHYVKDNLQVLTSRNICDELISTSNHPFLVERRGKFTYCEASLLLDKENLFTPIPKIDSNDNLFSKFKELGFVDTEENRMLISKLIGYYIAEGHLIHNDKKEDIGIDISLHSDEISFKEEIISISKSIFNKDPEVIDRNIYNHKTISMRIYHPLIVKFIKMSCLGLAKEKILSKDLISLPIKYLRVILAGYIDGDGHSDKYGRLIITTASKNLAYQVMHMFSLIGISATIGRYDQNLGPKNRNGITDIYRVNVAMLQTLKLSDCGIKCKKSSEVAKLKEGNQSKLQNVFSNEGFIKHTTYSIEDMPYEGNVYNFETESHSYVANNTSVHNCQHIKNRKGRKFTGTARNVVTGDTKQFKDQQVFEYNYGIKFIELSAVVDPACPSCRIQGVIKNDEYMKKAANIENSLRMVKMAAMDKQASKEEIDQIDQAIQTLENIAINLIKNRKQVEVSFASDLVGILAELQEWNDELVGAGYGTLQNSVPGTDTGADTGSEPGTESGLGGEANPESIAPEATPASPASPAAPTAQTPPAPSPVASETPIGDVGQVAGKASAPLVKAPQGPKLPITAPPRKASEEHTMRKLSETERISKGNKIVQSANKIASNIFSNNNIDKENGENDMGKRRTLTERNAQIEKTKQILSELWQEKQEFCEYIREVPSVNDGNCRLAVKKSDDTFVIVAESSIDDEVKVWRFEDLSSDEKDMIKRDPKVAASMLLQNFQNKKLEGVNRMLDNKKQAGVSSVNSDLDVVQEKQLDQAKNLYHPRTGEEQDSITQKQLEGLRGNEQNVVTQKQLDSKREGGEKDVVTQKQLESLRENDEKNSVTQDQLKNYRTDANQETITEDQLKNIASPWARAASRNPANFKTASEHMQSVIEAMAETAIETGSTPQELQKIASTLVAGTKARYDFALAITEEPKKAKSLPYSERMAFWSGKNVKFATASVADVEQALIGKLRTVASDMTINPEVIVEAVDVVGEDNNALDNISASIDRKLKAQASVETKKSIKSELRNALKPVTSTKEERNAKREAILASIKDDGVQTREAERNVWEKKIASKLFDPSISQKSDLVIEASFSEIGSTKNSPSFKKDIVTFAKGALSAHNYKLASIVNVTINNDTVQIAVQTENEEGSKESFQFPLGEDKAPANEEEIPEGDMSGEGLEGSLGTPESTPASTPAPAPAPAPTATASSKKQTRVAQTPAGGGIPGAPAGGAPDQAAGMNPSNPAGETPVQSLMTGAPEGEQNKDAGDEEEIPTVGEKQMPWTICPECGSSDVDVEKDNEGGIKGTCNACSAEYEAMIKKIVEFKIVKPTESVGEEGAETPKAPEAPELPALPVAASTRLTKGSLVRIAQNKKANGHVCPSCGQKNCKASVESKGHTECTCGECKTAFSKDIVVNSQKPEEAYLMVKWDAIPETKCPECVKKASKFASKIKVAQMLKSASANSDEFPMANCVERIAREYGGDTVGSFGPCKGKVLAECACKQLQRVGLTKVRHLDRIAKASMQKDPMDECIADQKKQGYGIKEACSICGVIKKKFANAISDNIFVHAFAEDINSKKIKDLTLEDLINMADLTLEEAAENAKSTINEEEDLDQDIKDAALPEAAEAEVEIEEGEEGEEGAEGEKNCPKCKKCLDECSCGSKPKDVSDVKEEITLEDEPEQDKETDMKDLLASSNTVRRCAGSSIRLAEKPKTVETIEGNVEAGVPRSKATLGNEGKDNIDVQMAKPSVPRKDAYMGKEKEADSLINKKLELPDVAKDNLFIGHEKEIQNGMPAINNEIKGTVIAETNKSERTAKKLKEVDSIDGDVKVPRGKATIGNEGKDNIDVTMEKPSVPRGNAYMGKEKEADSMINENLESPDVPTGDAYMGNEKEVQKGLPANNDEYLKLVRQKKEVQLERIANARREAARDTAAWLASSGRIQADRDTFDNVVKALSSFEIDKIKTAADQMFPERVKRTASKSEAVGHTLPAIILESKASAGNDLQTRLASQFTIGNSKFDNDLTIYGERK